MSENGRLSRVLLSSASFTGALVSYAIVCQYVSIYAFSEVWRLTLGIAESHWGYVQSNIVSLARPRRYSV